MEPNLSLQAKTPELPISLLQLLSYTLVLYQTAPYLPVSSLLALGATSKAFKDLIHRSPSVFRYIDLTQVKSAQSEVGPIDHGGEVWRNVQLDENVTEDDFYGGPLRGIFNNLHRRLIIQDIQTLILDGLSVPADLVAEIITQESFKVRILSIREVKNMNERKLQQAIHYAMRPSRTDNTLKLQGLYIFGPKDASPVSRFKRHFDRYYPSTASIDTLPLYGMTNLHGAQIAAQWNKKSEETLDQEIRQNNDKWFGKSGKIFPKPVPISQDWASTMKACQGLVSFDAVLCNGPRHSLPIKGSKTWYEQPEIYLAPRGATHALGGCSGCNSAPEGFSRFGMSPMENFPLLAPPPLHSSTIRAAKTPTPAEVGYKLLVRCIECLRNRYCESCHKWWCEDCYQVPSIGSNDRTEVQPWESVGAGLPQKPENNVKLGVEKSCFECGLNCNDCISRTQLMCKICGGGYCLIHNEGSTLTTGVPEAVVEQESCTE